MDVNSSSDEKVMNYSHRDRCATFQKAEVKALLNLITKYKFIILNKNTDSNTNSAKEKVWRKITRSFNDQKIAVYRSTDHLKTKWENLKRGGRKAQKKVDEEETDEIRSQVVCLIQESDSFTDKVQVELEINDSDEQNDTQKGQRACSDYNSDTEDEKDRRLRSVNFLPVESHLLVKLVREEKAILFMEGTSTKIIQKKNAAWERIAKRFNKINPQERPLNVLKTKFYNLKRRNENRNKIKLEDRNYSSQKSNGEAKVDIKIEPGLRYSNENDMGLDVEETTLSERELSPLQNNDESMDPLKFVLNTDSGIGSSTWTPTCNQSENESVVKLKIELLNYKLETAKLERKRLENAIKAEEENRNVRAIENSLRLRTARLEAVAAESKLMQNHPALAYTEQELLAQRYLAMPDLSDDT
ncbi:unnamed protein product [Leptosia nina]|uniref:Regulatory protein zeste n=1 Tax=Leptosia nina TaxID=320188 RepID=A0AAV1J797_9NEOP